ncbi:NAD(P)H-dependent glycerol-3-phosphate dehydrogenase [Thalassospira lucentensis]|uniref:NAD(P)H-dependent glycerol-3-phosphate dehydrogenase n=1 Tax=Thalassospira lucentensis TaxID=168935 RepID=UPI00142D7BC5|nr:NAD(P)H-dependent glycerol-3-phosphate dehydrogenase [Thalassospira lucentensis]NIZ00577.1 NAD(P)-dependent glycerol-3-phosphate dehydrogenase [Thalassospira lucentensis]
MKKRITVIGGGAWGTALAVQAVRAGADVELVLRNPDLAEHINANGENDLYLPGISLPGALRATTSYDGLRDADAVLLVTPAQHLRETLTKLAAHWTDNLPAVICSKGIETKTGALMAQVVTQSLGNVPVAVLSGPTFAQEVAKGLPAAITLACEDRVVGKRLVELIGTPEFRPYFSTDVAGVEVAGAIKNVLAIASGVVAGLELGDNARAALITRGIAEMSRLAVAMGGRVETMLGLAGLGDLTLTCTGTLSRNYTFGLALGQGRKAKDILAERRSVTEGVYTAASITDVAAKYGVEMPICKAVDQVANHDCDLRSTINGLLQRPFRDELEAAS